MRNLSPCTSANNTSPSYTPYSVPSQVEGITLSRFLIICLFSTERKIRKNSIFQVVNMAFADLISGVASLPLYDYLSIGPSYRLWKTSYRALDLLSVGTSLIPLYPRHHCRHDLLFLFIVFACNIGICRMFHKRKVSSQQGNRASQSQR